VIADLSFAKRSPDLASPDQTLVISVVKVRVETGDAKALLAEAAGVLQLEATNMPGFLTGEILLSVHRNVFVIRTEWTDIHAWSRSRYDARVGAMLEHCEAASKELEFEVYARHASVAGSTVSKRR
jgi:quinol monooxygenase YgiN